MKITSRERDTLEEFVTSLVMEDIAELFEDRFISSRDYVELGKELDKLIYKWVLKTNKEPVQ